MRRASRDKKRLKDIAVLDEDSIREIIGKINLDERIKTAVRDEIEKQSKK